MLYIGLSLIFLIPTLYFRSGEIKEAKRYGRGACFLIVFGILITMLLLAVLSAYLAMSLADLNAAGGKVSHGLNYPQIPI